MKKTFGLFAITFVIALKTMGLEAEMFSEYGKKMAFGYERGPAVRYWFTEKTGLDAIFSFSFLDSDSTQTSAGAANANESRSTGWSVTAGGLRALKRYRGIHYNLIYRARYGKSTAGFSNSAGGGTSTTDSYSLAVGPEIEIQVPFFSRLVVSANLLASWDYQESATTIGSLETKEKSTRVGFSNSGSSLDELMKVGIRYYF